MELENAKYICILEDDESSSILVADKECYDLIRRASEMWHDGEDFTGNSPDDGTPLDCTGDDFEDEYIVSYLLKYGIHAKIYEARGLDSIYW